jgi:FMN phosphatase YigB (HAD superfamily)
MKKYNLILDLGGVAFKEPEHFVFENLPSEIRTQFPADFKPPRIFLRAFDFVHLITNTDLKQPWLMGTASGTLVAQSISENIDKSEHKNFFRDESERLLIKHGAPMMLVPEQLAQWSILHKDALEFVKGCKAQDLRLLILSNWDPESFELLQKKYPEFFAHFDNEDIFIPATLGYSKPDPKAFDEIIKNRNLDLQKIIFIDDSATNVKAAQEYGLTAILHRDWDQTRLSLKELASKNN